MDEENFTEMDVKFDETSLKQPATEFNDDLDLFVRILRNSFSGKAGNKALREKLGWGDESERYWLAHGRALDSGQIISGRGKGGSVRLASIDSDAQAQTKPPEHDKELQGPAESTEQAKESDLYPGALDVIRENWVKSANYDEYLVEITAAKGKAPTGGKWSRPDISILATKSFPYLPSRFFDIITFEIKPIWQTTVEGVFEALSHQQFAHRSYVIFNLASAEIAESFFEKQANADRILGTARKHGIGVIIASTISDWETWDELVPAERCIPDPEQANRFIATCFSESAREKIIKWHK